MKAVSLRVVGCLALLIALLPLPVVAGRAELVIGLSADPMTLDPHAINSNPSNSLRRHIFESLVGQDDKQRLYPLLAESWRAVDDTTWEFKLRPGVRFHDGAEFTAQDVVYTVCRISALGNSLSSFTLYTRGIDRIEAPDPHTLVIHTPGPYPLLPADVSAFGIVSAHAAGGMAVRFDRAGCTGATTYAPSGSFDDRTLAVGTGPFRVVERVRGNRIVLDRNPDYWGPPAAWDRVVLRPIPNSTDRVSALLSGEVDMIENPQARSLARISDSPDLHVVRAPSNRTIFLALNQGNAPISAISGNQGQNPLKDVRVRQALSLAIDRDAIVGGIMADGAVPATQLIPPGFPGHDDRIRIAYDPVAARRLLRAAGYPEGFPLVLITPSDRYVNDERVAQAVARMLERAGVRVSVEASSSSVQFARAKRNEFGALLMGWGVATGEASSALRAVLATPDENRGFGSINVGHYSNTAVDAPLIKALATADDHARNALLGQAMKAAMDDFAVFPLYHEFAAWALRKSLVYAARADQLTLVAEVRPRD